MDQNSSIQNIWLIIAIWSFIYLSDYYLTIFYAKKYREHIYKHIGLEGSLEITPVFQKDVDKLRLVSPQFLVRWLLSNLCLYVLWWLSVVVIEQPQYFYFLVGALILREGPVHLRHFRNLTLHYIARAGGVKGKIEYSRWSTLKLSAAEFFGFCLMYLLFAVIMKSWFMLGGAFGCLIVVIQHWRLSKKALASSQVTQDESQNA